jgi:signal recognition particle receptor subunit beta
MVSMKTKTERTLFFDFLPVHLGELSGFKTRFLLYTVPGQVYYNATRKLVLKGVDAVVFVADSKRGKMDENVESLENLRENLKDLGLTLDRLPWVIQYNKRDLTEIYSLEELEAVLNPGRVPAYEGVASTGVGVVETFKGVSRLLLRKLAKDVGVPVVASTVEAEASLPAPAAVAANPIAPPIAVVPAAPVDWGAASPAPAVQETPVTVFAEDSAAPAWASPAPVVPDAPVTVYAADSAWTAEADVVPQAVRFEAEPLVVSEDRSFPPARETAIADPRAQFPPVAEPVRMRRPGSDDTSVWASRGDDDQQSDHHVSVGERLRRWLSRSPEPDDAAAAELRARGPEMAEPPPAPTVLAEMPSMPTPLPQPDLSPFSPRGEFVGAEEPTVPELAVAEPTVAELAIVEPAVAELTIMEPAVVDPVVAVSTAPEVLVPSLAAQPSAISQITIAEVTSPSTPPPEAGSWTDGSPLPPVPRPTPSLVSFAPPPACATQPPPRRRRPREIIVPLELTPDDLAEGVVLKVAIRMQQIAGGEEDETDQYAA